MDLVDIKFTGGINISGYNATGEISKFLVDKVAVTTSTVGELDPFKLKIEFNTVSRILVPVINSYIDKYVVPIPQNILGVFQISDIFLKYHEGYLYAGATPTFLPPSPSGPVTNFGLVF